MCWPISNKENISSPTLLLPCFAGNYTLIVVFCRDKNQIVAGGRVIHSLDECLLPSDLCCKIVVALLQEGWHLINDFPIRRVEFHTSNFGRPKFA
jgi:hypothetical protein